MRDLNEHTSIHSSRAKFKQRIAGGAVLLLILAIFLPFIFSHSHVATPSSESTLNQTANQVAEQTPQPASVATMVQSDQALADAEAQATPAVTANPDAELTQSTQAANFQPDSELTTVQNEGSAALPSPVASEDYKPMEANPPPELTLSSQSVQFESGQVSNKSSKRLPPPAASSWVVQVGSFTEPTYAKQLVAKLQQQGVKASIQPGPNNTFRVIVGPVNSHKKALVLQQQIKNQFKLSGIVRE